MQTAGLANLKSYAPGSTSLTGAGAMRSAALGTVQLYATMQGQRVLTEHFFVLGTILPGMFAGVVEATGYVLRDKAKEIHEPHILTGDTYRSIATGPLMTFTVSIRIFVSSSCAVIATIVALSGSLVT